MARDLQTLQIANGAGANERGSAALCMDADGMSKNLQMYSCLEGDNDQQYAAIDGFGIVADLWTGFSNCMGVEGPGCLPPRGLPKPHGVTSTWLSPRYHINDGAHFNNDPSGTLQINGTWLVFPDQSVANGNGGQTGAYYRSKDLVHWTRVASTLGFSETGGIAVTASGTAFTFGSGFRYINTTEDPGLVTWHSANLGAQDPHVVGRNGEAAATHGDAGLFRVGDPSRPFLYNGKWSLFACLGTVPPIRFVPGVKGQCIVSRTHRIGLST